MGARLTVVAGTLAVAVPAQVDAVDLVAKIERGQDVPGAFATLRGDPERALAQLLPELDRGVTGPLLRAVAEVLPLVATAPPRLYDDLARQVLRLQPIDLVMFVELWRLKVRLGFDRGIASDELIAALDGYRAFRVEAAIDAVGARRLRAALPALRRVWARPDPPILGFDRTVPLRRKAAAAILAIAPGDEIATAVLAGERAAPRRPELPPRLAAAVDELESPVSIESAERALRELAALGRAAAPVAPELFRIGMDIDPVLMPGVLEALSRAGTWFRGEMPMFVTSVGLDGITVLGRPVGGAIDDATVTAISNGIRLFQGFTAVDPGLSPAGLRALLAGRIEIRRDFALGVVHERRSELGELAPAVAALIEPDAPERSRRAASTLLALDPPPKLAAIGQAFRLGDLATADRRAAARALGRLGVDTDVAVGALMAALDDRDLALVGESITALGMVGARTARSRLEQLSGHPDHQVAARARAALKTLDRR